MDNNYDCNMAVIELSVGLTYSILKGATSKKKTPEEKFAVGLETLSDFLNNTKTLDHIRRCLTKEKDNNFCAC